MLVLPHHFQAAESWLLEQVATSHDWLNPYGYGVYDIEINPDALANYELRIPRLRVRLRDGTLVSVPENARLPVLDLRKALADTPEISLFLVLPDYVPGQANSAAGNGEAHTRFRTETRTWDEVHDGDNPRSIDFLRYNCELVVSPDGTPPQNCQSLPLARVKRSLEADSPPALDPDYFPPLLECRGWEELSEGILAAILSQLRAHIHSQAEYLKTHGGWAEANQPQIRRAIRKLDAVNSCLPVFRQLTETRGTHPRTAYLTLCNLLGELAILRDDWTPPELPLYNHERLGEIFRAIKAEIDAALTATEHGAKVQRFPLENVGQWMEVTLDPRWLQTQYEFYVGVRSDLPPERLEQLFSTRWLDWKLGASRTINQIYVNGEAGLSIKRYVGVHPQLPVLKDLTYFRVKKLGTYWEQVSESRTLALKVNERYIRQQAIGQHVLTVVDPKNTPRDLSLELFVLEND
ncbi:hypothetical protein Mal4_56070 [Maioricimonas rarisocia]|uniref:Uncharacterized protein n=2 Tax=Maioricimonas rarisocia TaxID=2528026 RepID=A0A517ZFM5_9PLAN|nr:hypothetical protein Mal4_56070 [Maioricimonas rarisocia]